MKVTFWGAVRTVTGSMHEVSLNGERYLLDCGLYQGRRLEAFERNRNMPFPGRKVDGVVLSHAHIDHSGNLPSLARSGFAGAIHATSATIDLCGAMIRDSAFLQQKDADYANKRMEYRKAHAKPHPKDQPAEPLYTIEDAERALDQMRPVRYHEKHALTEELEFEFCDAGHLLGSAAVVLRYRKNGKPVNLTFSGDVGRAGLPIIRDPEAMPQADYLIMESTYGNRLHNRDEIVYDKLAEVVTRAAERGGKLIVPAFAVGRTQQLVLLLHQLSQRGQIPNIPVFVDSPLAVNATEVYRKHPECYDEETARFLQAGEDALAFGRLRYIREVSESKALNDYKGPMIIISASGMCEGGRILHHLRNNIGDPKNTVMIVGFQAENTLGRKLVEGHPEVSIYGDLMRVRAEVVVMNELSGHADQGELIAWMKPIAQSLKKVFLVHGEVSQAEGLAALIRETYGVDAVIPERGQSFDLA